MTEDEFLEAVAQLVAGLQVPVSMMPRGMFGAAYEPWQKLLTEINHGFGWTNAEKAKAAFREILKKDEDRESDDTNRR